MNITIEQLMATIGKLHVQVDLLMAENVVLRNTISATKSEETTQENKPLTKES